MQLNFFLVSQDDKPFPGYDFSSNSFSPSKVYRHGYGFLLEVDAKESMSYAAQKSATYYLAKFPSERPLSALGVRTNSFFDIIDWDAPLSDFFSEGDTVVVLVDRRPNYKSPVPAIMKFLIRLSFLHVVHVAIVSVVVIFAVRNRFALWDVFRKIYNL